MSDQIPFSDGTVPVSLTNEEVTLLVEALDVQIEFGISALKQADNPDDYADALEQCQEWEALKVKLQGAK